MYAYSNKYGIVDLKTSPSAYGEIMTVGITPVMQVDFVYGVNTQTFNSSSLSGKVRTVNSNLCVECSGSAGSYSEVTTKNLFRYRPGQGNGLRFTSIFTTGSEGTVQLYGVGDSNDGYFIGMSGSNFGILRRSFGVDYWTLQEDFNLDKIDGSTGTSFQYEPSKGNVFDMQYQWLGYGAITFNIENPETGLFVPFHKIKYPNTSTSPSTQFGSNPVKIRVETNENTAIPPVIRGASMMAYLEGMVKYTGPTFSAINEVSAFSSTTNVNIITLRNETTFKGLTNKIPAKTKILTFSCEGNKPVVVSVYKNASLSGIPVYTSVDSDSTFSVTKSVVAFTGGSLVGSFTLSKSGQIFIRENDFDQFINPGETLTFAARTVSGGNGDIIFATTWVEDR